MEFDIHLYIHLLHTYVYSINNGSNGRPNATYRPHQCKRPQVGVRESLGRSRFKSSLKCEKSVPQQVRLQAVDCKKKRK